MAGVAQERAALSEHDPITTNKTKYRLRRDTARTWAIDRQVNKNSSLVWASWKWGSLEAMGRLFLHLSLPETEALTCYEQIVGATAAAEGRVHHAMSQAVSTSGGGELVVEL